MKIKAIKNDMLYKLCYQNDEENYNLWRRISLVERNNEIILFAGVYVKMYYCLTNINCTTEYINLNII